MSKRQRERKHGGDKKHGRNKREVNQAMSKYVRGKITFDQYLKRRGK